MLFPGVCTCQLGESASDDSRKCDLITMQSYNIRRHRSDDGWRCRAISGLYFQKKHHPSYFLHLTSSGFSQLLHDSPYLSGRERLAGGFIAHRLKLFP